MEELEVPTEKLHETLHEQAHERGHGDPMAMRVALSAACIAVFAAIAALLAGHHANEALLDQLKASDDWALYQAKGIKATMLAATADMLRATGHAPPAEQEARVEEYRREQKEIEERAHEEEHGSRAHLAHHQILARAVTLFQIGIALGAIAVLTRKRNLWIASLLLGAAGVVFFVQGVL